MEKLWIETFWVVFLNPQCELVSRYSILCQLERILKCANEFNHQRRCAWRWYIERKSVRSISRSKCFCINQNHMHTYYRVDLTESFTIFHRICKIRLFQITDAKYVNKSDSSLSFHSLSNPNTRQPALCCILCLYFPHCQPYGIWQNKCTLFYDLSLLSVVYKSLLKKINSILIITLEIFRTHFISLYCLNITNHDETSNMTSKHIILFATTAPLICHPKPAIRTKD